MNSRRRSFYAVAGIAVTGVAILLFIVFLPTALRRSSARQPIVFELAPRRIANGTDPSLAVRDTGDIYLLKVEKGNLSYEISRDGGDSFGNAVRVNDVDGEVASHAEATPRMYLVAGKPGVVWQADVGTGLNSTKLRFARSSDYGKSFSKAVDVDPTGLAASQSFFNLTASAKGAIYVVWLDGREKTSHVEHRGAAIYLARSTDGGGSFEKSIQVANDACPCCRPSIAFTDENTVHVGFRKIFAGDERDMAIASSTDGGKTWNSPVRIGDDHWQIQGCPHSGPSLATVGKRLFVSWFTVHEKEQQSYIFLAHSDDGGRTFSAPQWLSEGTVDPNHPHLVAASDRIFATFQARDRDAHGGWGKIHVFLRQVSAGGRMSPLMTIPTVDTGALYPTLAFESPDKVFLAWTESDDTRSDVVFVRGRLTSN